MIWFVVRFVAIVFEILAIEAYNLGKTLRNAPILYSREVPSNVRLLNQTISGLVLTAKIKLLHKNGCNSHKRMNSSFHFYDYVLIELTLPNILPPSVLNWRAVRDYASRQTPFPPIVIGYNGIIIDGKHRLYAARERGEKTILAYIPLEMLSKKTLLRVS